VDKVSRSLLVTMGYIDQVDRCHMSTDLSDLDHNQADIVNMMLIHSLQLLYQSHIEYMMTVLVLMYMFQHHMQYI
jgi:hypothetical protein